MLVEKLYLIEDEFNTNDSTEPNNSLGTNSSQVQNTDNQDIITERKHNTYNRPWENPKKKKKRTEPEEVTDDQNAAAENEPDPWEAQYDTDNSTVNDILLIENDNEFVEALKDYLNQHFENASKLLISNYKPKFLRKWVASIGPEELVNKNNIALKAFNAKGAEKVLNGSEHLFMGFYNLLIDRYLKINDNYLHNQTPVLYNINLYTKVKDEDDRLDLVNLDAAEKDPKKTRVINTAVNNNNYKQLLSAVGTTNKDNKFINQFKGLSDKGKSEFIQAVLGVDEREASRLLGNANTNNN